MRLLERERFKRDACDGIGWLGKLDNSNARCSASAIKTDAALRRLPKKGDTDRAFRSIGAAVEGRDNDLRVFGPKDAIGL